MVCCGGDFVAVFVVGVLWVSDLCWVDSVICIWCCCVLSSFLLPLLLSGWVNLWDFVSTAIMVMFSKALMMKRNSCWSLSEFRLQGIIMMARRILHGGCVQEMVQDTTVGVRPLRGLENDPATKGDTPDDRRADDIHLAEPKEITKEKAAKAQQEPPDFQVCQSPHP